MKLPGSVKNLISFIGALLALVSLLIIVVLFVLSSLFNLGSSYIGVFIYIVFPIVLFIGLLLIPIGIFRSKIKGKTEPKLEPKEWPVIDLNLLSVRNAALVFMGGTVCFIILSAIGSFEAFHLTESNEFCGKLCHEVMEPEYTAYQGSSHERVDCVECHVGSGAGWYVKSKMSGMYQVYSVLFKKYPRPIHTPIVSLRPARETCEECHWTEKFYDRKIRTKKSYMADEETTEWDIHLMMKTSATYSAQGLQEGIHWHINPDIKIEYRAKLTDRSQIPWVKYTNLKTGVTKIYIDDSLKVNPAALDSLELRVMDCMDCHNRPSHNFLSPANFIDELITANNISSKLPDIKMVAMDALNTEYSTKDTAFAEIRGYVEEYYSLMYPEILENSKGLVEQAIQSIQTGYSKNVFPEMKVSWDKYPIHLGHLETDGCYRCHNDQHKASDGTVISRDCNLCHHILAQGTKDNMEYTSTDQSLEFKHPIDINEAWRTKFCSECHFSLY